MIKVVNVRTPGNIEVVERDRSPLPEGSVRLRIEAIGICGSDVALMAGTHPYAVYPVVPGHELAGRVLETTDEGKARVGQLVAVRPTLGCGGCQACRQGRTNHCAGVRVLGVHLDGGMAEELVVPVELVYPTAEVLTAEHAAIAEPTAVALHACRRAGLQEGMSLAIIGSGVIGMLALQIARSWGCGPIFAVDRVPERLVVARSLGADQVLNSLEHNPVDAAREMCPDGFDVVMDMVGRGETLTDAAEMARRAGTIIPVALPHGPVQYDFELLYRKELGIVGSRLYNGDFNEAVTLLASGDVVPDLMITHRFPLEEASKAFSVLVDHPEEAIKVLVVP
jgi:2-desacetyl-2-hydroxyethyl bacteriochlorophyllide A dehydrogenase